MCRILEYIFSITSEQIIFKKEVNLNDSSSNIIVSEFSNLTDSHFLIVSKKIFKLRYSSYIYFRFISKLSWVIGLDCPILIPTEIITKMGSNENIVSTNEEAILQSTLMNLSNYHPTRYNVVCLQDDNTDNADIESLLPQVLISSMDKKINKIQIEIFEKEQNDSL